MKKIIFFITCLSALQVNAVKWQVGPGRTYPAPSHVSNLVNDGDTVEIDAGLYPGDCVAWTRNNLYLKGVGGMAHIEANGNYVWGKGIWVTAGNNTIVENIEFSGAAVPSQNGAGIRLDGSGLTVRHCYFHDNENGILGGSSGDILIEYSEFANNGFGDGYTHNIYINNANSFTMKFCYSHHSKVGHCVKSRANKNYILYNRIMDETTGNSSMNIDLPNGGLAIVIGNLIQQGTATENRAMLTYGLEGLINTAPHELFVINNTFIDQRGYNGLFISISNSTGLLKAYNNIFTGDATSSVLSGATATLDTLANLFFNNVGNAGLTDFTNFDYTLSQASPAINAGINPGSAGAFSLTPTSQYVHPYDSAHRINVGAIDAGAYEYPQPTGFTENDYAGKKPLVYYNSETDCINIISEGEKINSYYVYDCCGRAVISGNCKASEKVLININEYPHGIFLVKVKTQEAEYVRKIFR